jgi:hypothetical protein
MLTAAPGYWREPWSNFTGDYLTARTSNGPTDGDKFLDLNAAG